MRRQRVIDLDDPVAPRRTPPEDDESWEKVHIIDSAQSEGYEKRWREGNVLCIERCVVREIPVRYGIEYQDERSMRRVPARVNFAHILEAVEVEIDEHASEQPWDNCDGYEHRDVTIRDGNEYYEMVKEHANRGDVDLPCGFYRNQHGHGSGIIVLPGFDFDGNYAYYRARGASRQVARELVAASNRHTVDTLRKWYEDGWEWWGVKCEFDGYEDACYGFLSEEDAEDGGREEVAGDVAWQMQEDGYLISNWPAQNVRWTVRKGLSGRDQDDYRQNLKRKLNQQNWSHE